MNHRIKQCRWRISLIRYRLIACAGHRNILKLPASLCIHPRFNGRSAVAGIDNANGYSNMLIDEIGKKPRHGRTVARILKRSLLPFPSEILLRLVCSFGSYVDKTNLLPHRV
ncbi:hypothetical protein SDC9_175429 [bioreactor metagenome]|uniref:Uncharacterized protein n=1 Tax=bioreactor metagenome TaxID=1076179 RepID=A0A645GMP0_9ZZZZ